MQALLGSLELKQVMVFPVIKQLDVLVLADYHGVSISAVLSLRVYYIIYALRGIDILRVLNYFLLAHIGMEF